MQLQSACPVESGSAETVKSESLAEVTARNVLKKGKHPPLHL